MARTRRSDPITRDSLTELVRREDCAWIYECDNDLNRPCPLFLATGRPCDCRPFVPGFDRPAWPFKLVPPLKRLKMKGEGT
jgi:hypothetical protein